MAEEKVMTPEVEEEAKEIGKNWKANPHKWTGDPNQPLLEVKNLRVSYNTYAGEVQSVRGVNFDVKHGEILAVIGESGCGKSVTARTIMSLIRHPGVVKEGSEIIFEGKDVLSMSKKELSQYRGGDCGMIFQDALVALDPTMRVGKQIMENLRIHSKMSKKEAKEEAIRLLDVVGIPNAETRFRQYPFEFSGGMRQRAMIAMAVACQPKLVIADEPTTALDVTIQAQIMELLKRLRDEDGTSIILITHDFGVVAGFADKIVVMYAGQIVERGSRQEIFYHPQHPYTWALLGAVPRLDWENKQMLRTIRGTPPDLVAPPKGCPFARRCELCMNVCLEEMPPVKEFPGEDPENHGHSAMCWLYADDAPAEVREKAEALRVKGGEGHE